MNTDQKVQNAIRFYNLELPIILDCGKTITGIEMSSIGEVFIYLGEERRYYSEIDAEGMAEIDKLNELIID